MSPGRQAGRRRGLRLVQPSLVTRALWIGGLLTALVVLTLLHHDLPVAVGVGTVLALLGAFLAAHKHRTTGAWALRSFWCGSGALLVRAGLKQQPGSDGRRPRRRYTRLDALYDDLGENPTFTRWTHTPIA